MTVFKLKIIACITMLIDHFGAIILMPLLDEPWFYAEIYELTRGIGRIAFPIFAYLVAQGCIHTKDIRKYLLRLGFLAIISEPFFDMAFRGGTINFLWGTNIFYTLFLGAAAIAIYEKARQVFESKIGDIVSLLAVVPCMFAAQWLFTDYAHIGVGLIFLIYILRPENRAGRCIAVAVGMLALYFGSINLLMYSLVAVGLIALYNGKLGTNNTIIKWGFYFFYPAHIAVLITVRAIFFQ